MNPTSSRPTTYRSALLAAGCALGFLLIPAVNAADSTPMQPKADKALAALPVTAACEKVPGKMEGAPYVLKLKNTSNASLKVSAKVLLSVVAHNADKARNVPAHAIDAGQVWSIPELAAGDKVVVTADGFAPLEVTVK